MAGQVVAESQVDHDEEPDEAYGDEDPGAARAVADVHKKRMTGSILATAIVSAATTLNRLSLITRKPRLNAKQGFL